MSIANALKGTMLKAFLQRALDGKHGSTMLGAVAAAVMGANLDFGRLVHAVQTNEDAEMWGKLAGIAVTAAWGYYIGRKNKTINEGKVVEGGDPKTDA